MDAFDFVPVDLPECASLQIPDHFPWPLTRPMDDLCLAMALDWFGQSIIVVASNKSNRRSRTDLSQPHATANSREPRPGIAVKFW